MGMKSREAGTPLSRARPSRTGTMTTTTGVLFTKALKGITTRSVTTSSRKSLFPASLEIHLPSASTPPVRTMAADSTNMAATVTNASLAKPLTPSAGDSTPVTMRATMTMRPTTSMGSRSRTKSTRAPSVIPRVIRISGVTGGGFTPLPGPRRGGPHPPRCRGSVTWNRCPLGRGTPRSRHGRWALGHRSPPTRRPSGTGG